MKTLLLSSLLAVLFSMEPTVEPRSQEEEQKPLEHHDFARLPGELQKKGGVWNASIDNKTLTTGIDPLKKGSADGPSPHKLDEIYDVVKGKSKFEGEVVDARPGSVLFVAAHAKHRFLDIEEDLRLLVFFSKVPVPKKDG